MALLVSRRRCLVALPAAGCVFVPRSIAAQPAAYPASGSSMPSQDPAVVQEMVGASHGRVERVRELLKEAPQLANAAVDWGYGDWETALGAASHTGQREIAAMLMEHGARPDLFTYAMLGKLEAVRAMIEAQPGLQRTRGPHGITLLAHARTGGDESKPVVEYLTALGEADVGYASVPLEAKDRSIYVGDYTFGPGEDERFNVTEEKEKLWIRRVGRPQRGLVHLGRHTFHPAGAPDVRIAFEVDGGRAQRVRITTPKPLVEATRVA